MTSTDSRRVRRAAITWLLFVVFIHTLPSLWFLAVAAGYAPAVAIFASGVSGSFYVEPLSLAFARLLLLPALGYFLLYFVAAWGLASLLARVPGARLRTLLVALLTAAPVVAALFPIYVIGGHNNSTTRNLIGLWAEARLPSWGAAVYAAGLGVVVLGLLWAHAAERWLPRGALRRAWARPVGRLALLAPPLSVLAAFVWVNQVLLVCRPLAGVGVASAQYCLGQALAGPNPNRLWGSEGANVWLARAAGQGHADAAMLLAKRAATRDDRIRWLRVAAEAGRVDAQYQLHTLLSGRYRDADGLREAALWLRRSAEGGYAQAQLAYARALEGGNLAAYGIARDFAAATDWYERAAAQGERGAREAVAARLAVGGGGFPLDRKRAAAMYRELAQEARAASAPMDARGVGIDDDDRRAAEIEARAARIDAGDPQALREDALMRLEVKRPGPGVREGGIAELERLAESGDGQAAWELGAIYVYGRYDMSKDVARGRTWWLRAADTGHLEAMERVAAGYLNGDVGFAVDYTRGRPYVERLVAAYTTGPEADARRARYWREHLSWLDTQIARMGGRYESPQTLAPKADKGDAEAQYQLAQQILLSEPVWKHARAMELFKSAAEAGHAGANWELFMRYQRGVWYTTSGDGDVTRHTVLPKDERKAREHLMRAAEAHHARAMAAVALAYEKGRWGIPQDYEKARAYYTEIIEAVEQNRYGWEVDQNYLPFQRRRLEVVERILASRPGGR